MGANKCLIKVKNIIREANHLWYQEYNKKPRYIKKPDSEDLEIEENKPLIFWIEKNPDIPDKCPVEIHFEYDYNDNYHTNLIKFQEDSIPKWMILITRNVESDRGSTTTVNVTVGDDKGSDDTHNNG